MFQVKWWITINEPYIHCWFGHAGDHKHYPVHPPGELSRLHTAYAPYLCGYHMLIAHATAYRIYDNEFRTKQTGK